MPRSRDEAQVAEASRLYHLGLGTRAIAAQLGVDATTVGRWLDGQTRRPGPRGRTDVADAVILHLRDTEQLPWDAIAEETGMSRTGVRMRYLAAHGQPRPGRG